MVFSIVINVGPGGRGAQMGAFGRVRSIGHDNFVLPETRFSLTSAIYNVNSFRQTSGRYGG